MKRRDTRARDGICTHAINTFNELVNCPENLDGTFDCGIIADDMKVFEQAREAFRVWSTCWWVEHFKLVTDLEASKDLKDLMDELGLYYLGRLEPASACYGDIHLAADKNTGEYVPFTVCAGRAYIVEESEFGEYLSDEVDKH